MSVHRKQYAGKAGQQTRKSRNLSRRDKMDFERISKREKVLKRNKPTKAQMKYISFLRLERDLEIGMYPSTKSQADKLIKRLLDAPVRTR